MAHDRISDSHVPKTPLAKTPEQKASSAEFREKLNSTLRAKGTPSTATTKNKPLSERIATQLSWVQTQLSSLSQSLKAIFSTPHQEPAAKAILEFKEATKNTQMDQATALTEALDPLLNETLPIPPTTFPAIKHLQSCIKTVLEANKSTDKLSFNETAYKDLIDSLAALDTFSTHEPKRKPNWAQLKASFETLSNPKINSNAFKNQSVNLLKQIDQIVKTYIDRADTFNSDIAAAKNHLQTNSLDYLAIAIITCGVVGLSALLIGLGTTAVVLASPAIGAALFATGVALSFLIAATGSLGILMSVDQSNWAFNAFTSRHPDDAAAHQKAYTDEGKKEQFIDAQSNLKEKIQATGLKYTHTNSVNPHELNTKKLIDELEGLQNFIENTIKMIKND